MSRQSKKLRRMVVLPGQELWLADGTHVTEGDTVEISATASDWLVGDGIVAEPVTEAEAV